MIYRFVIIIISGMINMFYFLPFFFRWNPIFTIKRERRVLWAGKVNYHDRKTSLEYVFHSSMNNWIKCLPFFDMRAYFVFVFSFCFVLFDNISSDGHIALRNWWHRARNHNSNCCYICTFRYISQPDAVFLLRFPLMTAMIDKISYLFSTIWFAYRWLSFDQE